MELENSSYDFPESPIAEKYAQALSLDKQQVRTLDKKHLFLIAYEKTKGNIFVSCEIAGIKSRKTFYNWYKEDKEFKKVVDSTHEARRDFVDDLVTIKIMKNHGPTIRWFLSRQHPAYKGKRKSKLIGSGIPYNPFKKYQNNADNGSV